MKLCVIGADGLIGSRIISEAAAREIPFVGTSRRPEHEGILLLDLADTPSLPDELAGCTVVLCAAISSLAACQGDPERARRVNVTGPEALARWCAVTGSHLVFFSTSAVFDGSVMLPDELAGVSPRSVYGNLKAEAERRVVATGCSLSIVRPTKVVHKGMGLFQSWRTDLAAGRCIRPASDMPCAPVRIGDVVDVALALSRHRLPGVWHISSPDECCYSEMASEMAGCWGADKQLVRAATLGELGVGLENVPRHACLGSRRLADRLGIFFPKWRDVARGIAGDMVASQGDLPSETRESIEREETEETEGGRRKCEG